MELAAQQRKRGRPGRNFAPPTAEQRAAAPPIPLGASAVPEVRISQQGSSQTYLGIIRDTCVLGWSDEELLDAMTRILKLADLPTREGSHLHPGSVRSGTVCTANGADRGYNGMVTLNAENCHPDILHLLQGSTCIFGQYHLHSLSAFIAALSDPVELAAVEAAWERGETLHAAHFCAFPACSAIGPLHFLTCEANEHQK
jgi:hypothetical protein